MPYPGHTSMKHPPGRRAKDLPKFRHCRGWARIQVTGTPKGSRALTPASQRKVRTSPQNLAAAKWEEAELMTVNHCLSPAVVSAAKERR